MSDEHKHESGGHGGGGGGGHGHGPHGGGGHEEHEGAPEWLISFADNVALMMGFFVVLLAMNMKPEASSGAAAKGDDAADGAQQNAEMLDWAIGIREAFNNPIDFDDPRDALLAKRLLERQASGETSAVGTRGSEHTVRSIRPTEHTGLAGVVHFETGSDELTEDARASIGATLRRERGHRVFIEVRGHVSAAESFGRDDRGMELAYRRARVVADALVADGIAWERMRLVACADNDRVAQKVYDHVGHAANQRVEVIATDEPLGGKPEGEQAESQPAEHGDDDAATLEPNPPEPPDEHADGH